MCENGIILRNTMESKLDDNDNDKLLIIDVFLENEGLSNNDYFLNKETNESVAIADIYFNDDMLNETPHEKSNCNEANEMLIQQEIAAPVVYLPNFLIINDKHSNGRILIDNRPDNRRGENLYQLGGKNRSVLRKIIPKPVLVYESSEEMKNRLVGACSIIRPTFKCVVCSSLFIDSKDFQTHLKEHYFQCEECPECFSNKLELLEHVQFTHSYNIIKHPEGVNVETIEVLKVIPYSPIVENFELSANPYGDIESSCVNENIEGIMDSMNSSDDSFITLEEAKEMQMKMEAGNFEIID